MRLAVPALALVLLLSARRAWADDEGCAPGVPLAVDGLGTAADDLARVGELAGAVAPSPRVIRGGGGTLRDALVQRGHAEAWLVGLQKVWRLRSRWVRR